MKGKHGKAAANRREQAANLRIGDLETDKTNLQARLEAAEKYVATHNATVSELARLRVDLADTTSDEVRRLNEQIVELSEQLAHLKKEDKRLSKVHGRGYQRICEHFIEEHNMSSLDAMEVVTQAYGHDIFLVDWEFDKSKDSELHRQFQKARRKRLDR